MDKRVNLISIIVGTRSTGKTTYMKGDESLKLEGIIDSYQDKDPNQKILIVDLFDNPVWRDVPLLTSERLSRWKSGMYRIFDRDFSHLVTTINTYCFNTVVFFEDATKYIRANIEENLRQLLIDSKQKNLDVFFAFHYLMAAPPDLVRISDYLVLFKTNEAFSSQLKNKYPHPAILSAFEEVSKHPDFHYYKTVALI
ncbi:MAG: hypothetical protein PHX80_05555 [Candidatus Nanoarchaeia archaeon]|nr:hypothetical protein [Candidatus Nanoarchaeia archaeon]